MPSVIILSSEFGVAQYASLDNIIAHGGYGRPPAVFRDGLSAVRENASLARYVHVNARATPHAQGDLVGCPMAVAKGVRDVEEGDVFRVDDVGTATPDVDVELSHYKKTQMVVDDGQLPTLNAAKHPIQINEHIRLLVTALHCVFDYHTLLRSVGTEGVSPFASDVAPLLVARKMLNDSLAPRTPRYALLNPDVLDMRVFQDSVRRTGNSGTCFGMRFGFDQDLPAHTNLIFHRDAFIIASRPEVLSLDNPLFEPCDMIIQGQEPDTGLWLSLRVRQHDGTTQYEWSMLFGTACQPDLAVRLLG